ncbi:MAG TPA: UDP-N-acetylmuramoyl-L-alanyl-D-glutamate--2,6-diaminopimelate ligase [Candidatus Limnocylindria bacterium]|nr:UDP-N-acetylmuramoyl-L-alanyl-D-glutamate--2,6-diaminopimelate ligase [Candidatus Limnocylindria bacterium]
MLLSMLAGEALSYALELRGDCEILSLCDDSREKAPQGLFFCIRGSHYDAHAFAADAVRNGACALVVTEFQDGLDVPQLRVSDVRPAMALMARAFYGFPDREMKLVGITGTKGKTTTSYLVKAILEENGARVGLIGTTGSMIGDRWVDSTLTTPDPIELHRTFRQMADAGCAYVVMEVSAHAVAMHRLEGLTFEAGCFTNLSHEHLDYFSTMENYYQAKKKFFTGGMVRNAVLSLDDEWAARLSREIAVPSVTYGICTNADLFARDIQIREDGVSFLLGLFNDRFCPVDMRLMGMFNIYNAMAAAGIGLVLGVEPEVVCDALESVRTVPGRAEVLDTHTDYKVILDYSHSPDALENILSALRTVTKGRIIAVFGCGGERDATKRPVMGAIAGRMADLSILTSDNPRAEDPMDILGAIVEGIEPTGGTYEVIENRREAIRRAMALARSGDVVLLAGKGHETYQEILGVKRPFNEKQIVADLLREERAGGKANA